MLIRRKALLVHLLTATGAVLSMMALLSAVAGEWSMMFLWLVVAFVVDGIDGPLARRYEVTKNWPAYDGVLMDLIIDYLTYVFIPAFALYESGLLTGWAGLLAIILIVYGSVVYFADTRMKTRDNSFAGFPGCWNMVVLVLFAVHPPWTVTLITVLILTVAMFTNIKFIHPIRTRRWREVTLPVAGLWVFCAGVAAWGDFHPDSWAIWGLILSSAWLMLAGALQQLLPERC